MAPKKGLAAAGISLLGSNNCLDDNELKLALLYHTEFGFALLQKKTFLVEGLYTEVRVA
jgi:hypothetical protein